jgi:hypothetical protein
MFDASALANAIEIPIFYPCYVRLQLEEKRKCCYGRKTESNNTGVRVRGNE